MLELYWTGSGMSHGTTDYFPLGWFEKDTAIESASYEMHDGGGRFIKGSVSVTVSGNEALIDYGGRNADANRKLFVLGKYRIKFADRALMVIDTIEWSDTSDIENFSEAPVRERLVDDSEAEEGGAILSLHLRRERSLGLRAKKIEDVRRGTGNLACEACDFDFATMYGALGRDFCEVHHRIELAQGTRLTVPADLAVLCSNCHRMIHKTKPMKTVEEFRAYLEKQKLGSR